MQGHLANLPKKRQSVQLQQLARHHAFICPQQDPDAYHAWKIEGGPRKAIDHVATLHIIIEQSLEWQSQLYTVFVDFEKAFDSVDREVFWKLMAHCGIPPKFVSIIQQLYSYSTCQVIYKGELTEPFEVRTGVRQVVCCHQPTFCW